MTDKPKVLVVGASSAANNLRRALIALNLSMVEAGNAMSKLKSGELSALELDIKSLKDERSNEFANRNKSDRKRNRANRWR